MKKTALLTLMTLSFLSMKAIEDKITEIESVPVTFPEKKKKKKKKRAKSESKPSTEVKKEEAFIAARAILTRSSSFPSMLHRLDRSNTGTIIIGAPGTNYFNPTSRRHRNAIKTAKRSIENTRQ